MARRVSNEHRIAPLKLNVVQAEYGALFLVPLDQAYLLLFGLREMLSIDATLDLLKQNWSELLKLLNVEPPQL